MNSLHSSLNVDPTSTIFANGHSPTRSDNPSTSRISPPMSQLISADVDSVDPLSMTSMQVSPSNLDSSPMDLSSSSPRAPSPNLNFAPDSSLDAMSDSLGPHSSPSTTSAVSSGSHVSSSPLNGLPPAYNVGSSSLASALDDMGVGRPRSNSSASPVNYMSESQDLGVHFPPADLDSTLQSTHDPLPPKNLRVVDNMLQRAQQTVHSAREACSMGQRDEANMRIDELSRIVQAVSDLIASAKIVDGPPSPPNGALGSGPLQITSTGFLPPDYPPPGAETMGFEAMLDAMDSSRKRCASSMANGERMIKAPKLEPQDDFLLHIVQGSATIPNPQNSFPFGTSQIPVSINRAEVKPGSLPPSAPTSRPSSSSGIISMQISSSAGFIHPPLTLPAASLDMNGIAPASHVPALPYSGPPVSTGGWSDVRGSFPSRPTHQHSLSVGSLHGITMPDPASVTYPIGNGFSPAIPSSHSQAPLIPSSVIPASIVPSPSRQHVSRQSRSSSMSNLYMTSPYCGGDTLHPKASNGLSAPQSPISSSPEYDNDDDSDCGEDYAHSPPMTMIIKGGTVKKLSDGSGSRPKASRRASTADANEIPQEFRSDVDRIFFEFLSNVCSNLDATDAKGETIHQTLMAKKMQRLDESPDFRPFKFRIQAFTNAFLEELARQGLADDKIPMKKIRNYLWSQPYISRFNEEGKKTKSKGNHIWHIDAKKSPDGGWVFRPFHRRLAGSPPSVAYVGLRWSWQPRIWDPQGAKLTGSVRFSSPSLPPWLAWKEDVLSGVPPADAQSCEVTVRAEFALEGQEDCLSQTIQITIAPMAAMDTSLASARRPSLVGDSTNRRVQSDSVLQQTPPRLIRSQTTLPQTQTSHGTPDVQVVQVLNEAAERVSQAVQSQVVGRHPVENSPGLQALAKQQHVLSVSAQAVDNKTTNQVGASQMSNVLMAAAQQVVYQAACQVASTNSVTSSTSLSVQDVSAATLSAVAQAVDIVGPLSSEVEVMVTASSLLQQQQQSRSAGVVDSSQIPTSHESNSSSSLPVSFTAVLS